MSSTRPRTSPPRRRYNPYYHQMGDHTLFHNASTARMFPALTRLSPDRLSEIFRVPPVDKANERLEEVRFSEPYQPYQQARMSFRPLESPVRDEQQRKVLSSRSRSGADGPAAVLSADDYFHRLPGRPSSSSSPSLPLAVKNQHYQMPAAPLYENGVSPTIRIHGSAKFKVATVADAKETIRNTIPSLNIGFDVDETLHQAKLAEEEAHKLKQCLISSSPVRVRVPSAPQQRLRRKSAGEGEERDGAEHDDGKCGSMKRKENQKKPNPNKNSNNKNTNSNTTKTKRIGSDNSHCPPATLYECLVYRPFSRGTVADAQKRLTTDWYLNNSPNNPLENAIRLAKEESRRARRGERQEGSNAPPPLVLGRGRI